MFSAIAFPGFTVLVSHRGKESAITTHQFQRPSSRGRELLHSSVVQDSVYQSLVSDTWAVQLPPEDLPEDEPDVLYYLTTLSETATPSVPGDPSPQSLRPPGRNPSGSGPVSGPVAWAAGVTLS